MTARILEGRNRANSDEMASYINRIEELDAELLREKMAYMERARRIQENKKAVLDEAKEDGLSKKAVRAVVKVRELERKAEAAREDLEDDDAATFDDIREALGDFADSPLGQAAVERDETTNSVIDAVKGDLSDEEQDEWDQAAPDGEDE
ncbi:hypothetical protein [Hoeflea sp.]|uniref:hypothetical protein n=1 Tax=Hoeflea sp. TaxID=1940281 RepID=UPI003B5223EE